MKRFFEEVRYTHVPNFVYKFENDENSYNLLKVALVATFLVVITVGFNPF